MKTLFLKSGLAIFIFATFLFTIVSCTQTAATPELEPAAVNNITGTVVDQLNVPQANVQIQVGSETTTTSASGTYSINSGGNADGFIYLTARKPGFIEGSKTFRFSTNTTFNVKIMLVSNTVTATINTGVESTVTLANGTRVRFPKFYVDQNNAPYEGLVSVSMYQLLESNTNKKFVNYGFVLNNNSSIIERKLKVFGTIIIELKGSSGQLLDIDNYSTFKATLVLENNQLQNTPESIEMLFFDDVNGYWRPSGSAITPLNSDGSVIGNERKGTSVAKANRYNFSRSNRKGGIIFVGDGDRNTDLNTEMGVTATKK